MSPVEWLILVTIGAFGGWLASLITRGHGIHSAGTLVIGVAASILGGIGFESMGGGPIIIAFGGLFVAFMGAVVLLVAIGTLREVGSRRS